MKAGTTSLFYWLAEQDAICAATKKEPRYWSAVDAHQTFRGPGAEHLHRRMVTDPKEYAALFPKRPGLRGEGSTNYLYDREALLRLHNACRDCKIIVALREPVARMHAAYRDLVGSGWEDSPSFDAALEAEQSRIAAGWWSGFHYRRGSSYASHLRTCFDVFGREAVHVLFFEDLIARRGETLSLVAEFLGFRPDSWELPHAKEGLVVRHPWLRKSLTLAVELVRPLAPVLKAAGYRSPGRRALQGINGLTLWKPALPNARRAELQAEFSHEVATVESVLGRRVPHEWRLPASKRR